MSVSSVCIWLICLAALVYTDSPAMFYCRPDNEVSQVDVTNGMIYTLYEHNTIYNNNQQCAWVIGSSGGGPNMRVSIKVSSSHLEWAPVNANCHGYDFIQIRDGASDSADVIAIWCGDENPVSVTTTGGAAYLSFHSNDRNTYTYTGATLLFYVYDVAASLGSCGPGWKDDSSLADGGDYCYSISHHQVTWTEAQGHCAYDQSNLVSYHEQQQADFVTQLLRNESGLKPDESVWIGLNDIEVDGEYRWVDKTASPLRYRWREVPHKSDGYLNCVVQQPGDGLWANSFCNENNIQTPVKHKFICKTDKVGTTVVHKVPNERITKGGEGYAFSLLGVVIGVVVGVLVPVIVIVLIVKWKCRQTASQRKCTERTTGSDAQSSMPMNAMTTATNPDRNGRPAPSRAPAPRRDVDVAPRHSADGQRPQGGGDTYILAPQNVHIISPGQVSLSVEDSAMPPTYEESVNRR